jgi:hypothetical protein
MILSPEAKEVTSPLKAEDYYPISGDQGRNLIVKS